MALIFRLGRMDKIRGNDGFTYVELVGVLLILSLLASLSFPMVTGSIERAKEAALLENLSVLRGAIDAYFADNLAYPETIDVLAERDYVNAIPIDPTTGEPDWVILIDEKNEGINDVRSTNSKYAEW